MRNHASYIDVHKWNNAPGWPRCDDPDFGAVRGVRAIAGRCTNWRPFIQGEARNEPGCLLYVAPKGSFTHNTRRDSMRISNKRQHIGNYYKGTVFHYENGASTEAAVAVPITDTSGGKNFNQRYTRTDELWASDFPRDLTVEMYGSLGGFFPGAIRYVVNTMAFPRAG